MDDPLKKRRQLLQAAGVGGTALLAGCSGLLDSTDDESGDDGADDGTDTDDETNSDDGTNGDDGMDSQDGEQNGMQSGDGQEVGMVAQPDQEAITELRQQLQAGELEQQEAIDQQRELVSQSVEELTSAIESETDLEVTEQFSEIGALRANGAPVGMIDMLSNEWMNAIVSIERIEQQQQQQPDG